jgi:hypothetical protein
MLVNSQRQMLIPSWDDSGSLEVGSTVMGFWADHPSHLSGYTMGGERRIVGSQTGGDRRIAGRRAGRGCGAWVGIGARIDASWGRRRVGIGGWRGFGGVGIDGQRGIVGVRNGRGGASRIGVGSGGGRRIGVGIDARWGRRRVRIGASRGRRRVRNDRGGASRSAGFRCVGGRAGRHRHRCRGECTSFGGDSGQPLLRYDPWWHPRIPAARLGDTSHPRCAPW